MSRGLLHARGTSRPSHFWMGSRSFVWTIVFGPLVSGVLCLGQQAENSEVQLTASAQKPRLVVQTYHFGMIRSVAFSPDGHTLASGSADRRVKLWDVDAGRELRTLTGFDGPVVSVAFSPDGRTLVSADKSIKLWDVATGRRKASADKTITLWDHAIGRVAGRTGPDDVLVAFSPDGRIVASAYEATDVNSDKTITLWDLASGRELRTLTGPGSVLCLALSPDGHTLASSHWDNTVKLWDVDSGSDLYTLGHSGGVISVAFSWDGRTLATGDGSYNIKLWDVDSGSDLHIPMTGVKGAPVRSLATQAIWMKSRV